MVTSQEVEVFDGETWAYYDQSHGLFADPYQTIKTDGKGGVWLGHAKGITHFNGREFTNITQTNGTSLSNVNSIAIDQNGNPWFSFTDQVTNKAGIVKVDNGSWQAFTCKALGMSTCSDLAVSFAADKIWVGVNGGSEIGYLENNLWRRFEAVSHINQPRFSGKVLSDAQNNLWFLGGGVETAVYKYANGDKSWQNFNFGGNYSAITAGATDGSHVWFSSAGTGTFKVDCATGSWNNITTWNGLPIAYITGIFIERPSRPWVIGGAVSRLNGQSWSLELYDHFRYYEVGMKIMQDVHGGIWQPNKWPDPGVSVTRQGTVTTYPPTNSLLNRIIKEAATDLAGTSYFAGFDKNSEADGQVIMFDGSKWYDLTSKHTALTGDSIKIVPTSDGKTWFFSSSGTVVKDGTQ